VDELEALVKKAAADDQPLDDRLAAFGAIVRRYQDMAYGCAYALLGDFHLAEDAAQEAFVAAYRQLPKLRTPEAFPAWFRRIVQTQCNRITRRKHPSTTRLDAAAGVPSAEPGPSEILEKREMSDRVLAALRQLPEHQRLVTTLFYVNGYSQKHIADFLDVPVTTVKKRLHDARKKLKERMMGMVEETLKSVPLPDDFADVVVRKATSGADLGRASDLLSYSGRKRPQDFGSAAEAEQAGIYVVGPEGRVDGAGYFNEFDLSIGSTVVKAVRPGEMGAEALGVPDPAFVKSFRACFKLAAERGIHVAAVHGSQFDHAFCGFVPCFYYPVATLPCEIGRKIETDVVIRDATEDQKREARRAYLCDEYAPKMSAYIAGGVPHVIEQGGKVVGYVRVDSKFAAADYSGMGFGYVNEITVQTREAALAVLKLAGQLAEKDSRDEVVLPYSHMTRITRTILSLGGSYLLRGSCDLAGLDAEMVAVIDLLGLTRDLENAFRSRLQDSGPGALDAAFSVEMDGKTVGFVVDSGHLEIIKRRQTVHLMLPRWVVTRLYTGYHSGEDVLAMGPIPYDRSDGKTPDNPDLDMKPLSLPDGEAALFKALFPGLWPSASPDPDVWPWVLGKPHPRYQGEERKTREMKKQIDGLRFPWMGY